MAHDEDYTDETWKETHLQKKIVSIGETTSRPCSSRTSTSVAVAATSQETVATSDIVSEEPEINMFGTVMVTTSNGFEVITYKRVSIRVNHMRKEIHLPCDIRLLHPYKLPNTAVDAPLLET